MKNITFKSLAQERRVVRFVASAIEMHSFQIIYPGEINNNSEILFLRCK